MENLSKIFNINKNDIISISGTGGKTTLMFSLAQSLCQSGSVLITTSTKIALPETGFDKLYKSFDQYQKPDNNEIVVLGEYIEGKNKLKSIGYENLKEIISDFDYVLIEADGSRNLPMKYWYDYEPVIYDFSTKAIGVCPIKVYGKRPSPDFIYNYEDFIENIGNEKIDYNTFNKLISYKNGYFKDFIGDKYVFINQVESDEDIDNIKEIIKNNKSGINLVYGSLLKENFYEN